MARLNFYYIRIALVAFLRVDLVKAWVPVRSSDYLH